LVKSIWVYCMIDLAVGVMSSKIAEIESLLT
jgi:hypothetical protein